MMNTAIRWSLGSILLVACATAHPYVWVDELPATAESPRIREGDRISVQVKDQAALSGEFLVRANGAYLQPVLGEVPVAGHTPEAAATELAKKLKGVVVDPLVAISVSTPRSVRIAVIGEVRTPGTFELATPEGVLAVLARAGGLTEFASPAGIYVVREQPERRRVRFRYADLAGAAPPAAAFRLADGDVVVVE